MSRTLNQFRDGPGIAARIRPQRSGAVKKLAGRTALVTGGAVRVGRAIALALAGQGCDVAIGYHRSAAAARATERALLALGVRACRLRADLRDPRAATALVHQAARALGRLDLLVNNAAVFPRTPLGRVRPEHWDAVLAVNLRAPFFCAQAAAALMRRRGGRIVNVVDTGALRAWPAHLPYTVSKAALAALTRGLAVALAPRIQVNAVGPGLVLPPAGPARTGRRLLRGVPMGRLGAPEDVAEAVLFLATCSDYLTGQVLYVDGGASAR
jgi:NAD(P)-dependent dehydrogenase (short-subunit alcohol dehydrogenase family)